MYLRRDGTGANSLYTVKTTGVTLNTGWENYTTTAVGPGTTYRKTTPKTVNTTVTETDLLNGEITVGAGVLGTTSVLRLTAWGDWLQNSGGGLAWPRFKLKLGATTIIDTGAGPVQVTSSALRGGWKIVAEIMNLGATNSQWANIDGKIVSDNSGGTATFTTGEGGWSGGRRLDLRCRPRCSRVETPTVAQALVLSVINPSASASVETKLYGALVEII